MSSLHTEYLARVGPWGFNRGGWERPAFRDGTDVGDLFEEGGIAEESASVEGVDHSGTNVQEAGVDEADIVKTDGRRIFTLSSGRLVVVDASGRTRAGTVTVAEGWGRELFIDGDSLLVITRSTSDAPDGSETVLQRIDVSGGSPYLHPISDTLVLGVGSDADEDGRVTGAKISLFDVSDLTAPREVTVWTAPDGWNDVGWDHRAFLWWAPEGLAVIPLRVWGADREWSGAVALRVAEGAITEAGRIEHAPGAAPPPPSPCRHITPEDLPAREAGDMTQFEETVGWLWVLACEPHEQGLPPDAVFTGPEGPVPPEEAPPGWPQIPGLELSCDPVPLSEEEQAVKSQITTPDETINYCWINVRRSLIVRSIVIGDDLWTLSYPRGNTSGDATGRLEVNDLDTLERLAGVDL